MVAGSLWIKTSSNCSCSTFSSSSCGNYSNTIQYLQLLCKSEGVFMCSKIEGRAMGTVGSCCWFLVLLVAVCGCTVVGQVGVVVAVVLVMVVVVVALVVGGGGRCWQCHVLFGCGAFWTVVAGGLVGFFFGGGGVYWCRCICLTCGRTRW